MAYRDLLMAPLVSAFVVSGLDESTVSALPAAVRSVVRHRMSARSQWPGPVLRPRFLPVAVAEALVDHHVHRVTGRWTDAQLIASAHEVGLAGLPLALTVCDDRFVLMAAHAVFDGSGALELIHDLLDAAAGIELVPAEGRPAPLPVLRALRRVRFVDVRLFVGARRGRPKSPPISTVPSSGAAASTAFALDPHDLAAIRRYREPGRTGRATLHSRIASLVVAALAEVEVGCDDLPILMTSDVRHLVDGPVRGNFISREVVGTLHGDQWAPAALAARMMRLKEPGQAIALVWGPTGWLLRSALGRRPRAGDEIVLTLATTRRGFPVPVSTVTATSLGGSLTFGFAWRNASGVFASVFSSSGRFELDRFEEEFRRIVRERAG